MYWERHKSKEFYYFKIYKKSYLKDILLFIKFTIMFIIYAIYTISYAVNETKNIRLTVMNLKC